MRLKYEYMVIGTYWKGMDSPHALYSMWTLKGANVVLWSARPTVRKIPPRIRSGQDAGCFPQPPPGGPGRGSALAFAPGHSGFLLGGIGMGTGSCGLGEGRARCIRRLGPAIARAHAAFRPARGGTEVPALSGPGLLASGGFGSPRKGRGYAGLAFACMDINMQLLHPMCTKLIRWY